MFKGLGGGCISPSVSDSFFNVIHAAKTRKIKELNLAIDDVRRLKLVGYTSDTTFPAC